jgi:NAD(P)-dependent dehydrogenase (short-subunit alcohol dehydrogenase family)
MSRRIMVTGASRGIGLALCELYLGRGDRVVAAVREPASLAALAAAHPEALEVLAMDVADEASVLSARKQCHEGAIDVLINNAGMTGGPQRAPGMDIGRAERIMSVNALGPLRVYDAFVDLVRLSVSPAAAAGATGAGGAAGAGGKIVNISSEAGSLGGFRFGSKPEYAMSKAALNMLTRWVAAQEPTLVCASLHPGWVRTATGGPGAPDGPDVAAPRLAAAIDLLTPSCSGGFFSLDLSPLPWLRACWLACRGELLHDEMNGRAASGHRRG